MPITDEIQQAARDLGALLAAEAAVVEFAHLKQITASDPEVISLEARHAALYESLAQCQASSQSLDLDELDQYYDLKSQVQEHPLIAAREAHLVSVKALFARAAQHLSGPLGLDFSAYANRDPD